MPGAHSKPAPPEGLPPWWATARDDQLSPWALAQVQALIRCSEKFGLDLSDAQIAGEVTKGDGEHPTKQSIQKLRTLFASDPGWYPGKEKPGAKKRGPKPTMTEAKKRAIASAAMGLKRAGVEPSVSSVVEQAPRATLNPKTNAPYTEKYIAQVFRSYCFDAASAIPWDRHAPLQKTAIPPQLQLLRETWGKVVQNMLLEPRSTLVGVLFRRPPLCSAEGADGCRTGARGMCV